MPFICGMRVKIILTLLLFITGFIAHGQTAHLVGVVRDEKGKPLDAVTVAVEGTAVGIITNAQGEYTLDVPAVTIKLVFSAIGFQ